MKFNNPNIVENHGKPESTVRVTKNEVPNNHPKRVWGIARVLAVKIPLLIDHYYRGYTKCFIGDYDSP